MLTRKATRRRGGGNQWRPRPRFGRENGQSRQHIPAVALKQSVESRDLILTVPEPHLRRGSADRKTKSRSANLAGTVQGDKQLILPN